jgi:GR25 family glycosyltransferase involved in LPS biosynthesis
MKIADLPVYVIHGEHLVERRERLELELEANGIEAEWVTDPHTTALTPDLVRRYHRKSRWLWRRRTAATVRFPFRPLTPHQIAVTISHIETYRRIAESDSEWTLIFEDDAVLEPEFAERFDEYFSELPGDADFVFIGSCCGLRIDDVEPGRHFYRKGHPATKCVDSYLIRRSAARTVLRTITPFVLAIDWELNYQLKRHDLVVYWLEPPLVSQGSETGVHASSQR